MRPAAHLLFLSRQEKKAKEGDPKPVTRSLQLRAACDARPGCERCGTRCRLLWSLPLRQPQRVCRRADACCAAPVRTRGCASRHGHRGFKDRHAGLLRSLGWNRSLCRESLLSRRGAQGQAAARPAQHGLATVSDSLRLSERSAPAGRAQRVPQRLPATSTAGYPSGRDSRVAFLWLLSLARQRK